MEVKMHNYSIEEGHSYLFLCKQLNEAINAGYTYVMEDALETLVLVSMPLTHVSPRLIIWSCFFPEGKCRKWYNANGEEFARSWL
jgi:hypothetical protein